VYNADAYCYANTDSFATAAAFGSGRSGRRQK
jgi:hypothetical protein